MARSAVVRITVKVHKRHASPDADVTDVTDDTPEVGHGNAGKTGGIRYASRYVYSLTFDDDVG
jgi:hypothetical protein